MDAEFDRAQGVQQKALDAGPGNDDDLVIYDAYEKYLLQRAHDPIIDTKTVPVPRSDSPLYRLSPESLLARTMERRADWNSDACNTD